MTTTAAWLYVATLADRYGDQDIHMELLVPGATERERDQWASSVINGIVRAIGRSGNLVELVVSADRHTVLGIGCPVEDAVRECVAYLRRLEGEQTQATVATPSIPRGVAYTHCPEHGTTLRRGRCGDCDSPWSEDMAAP